MIATAVALALLPAASALAGDPDNPAPGDVKLGKIGGFTYLSDAETVTNPAYTAALTSCPGVAGPWRITGGGFKSNAAPAGVTVAASRPLDLDDSFYGDDDLLRDDYWEAAIDAPVGTKVTTYSICAKLPKLTYVNADTPDSTSTDRTAVDSCSGRRKLTGGGGFIATTGSHLNSIAPAGPRKWGISAYDANGGSGGMTSDFVCLRSKKLKTVAKSRTVAAASANSRSVSCPRGSHVTGGGASLSGSLADGYLTTSFPIDGRDDGKVPDDGWSAQAQNDSAAPIELEVSAICMR